MGGPRTAARRSGLRARCPRGPPAGPPPGTWGAPAPAAPKRSPLTGARLLAWTGGAVTLLGVVLLLALAASRGWFTPPARVAFGAVLGAGLVGLGMWLHRRESARAGALALVATGFATLYLVDAAATAIFDYLPALPALLLALVIAGAGLGLADRWRTQLLAGGVVVGAAVLAPALADGRLLVALVLVLQLAALLVVLRRRWAVLMLLAAAGPVLYGMYAVAVEEAVLAVVGVAAAVLVVALATAVLALRRIPATPALPRESRTPTGALPQPRLVPPAPPEIRVIGRPLRLRPQALRAMRRAAPALRVIPHRPGCAAEGDGRVAAGAGNRPVDRAECPHVDRRDRGGRRGGGAARTGGRSHARRLARRAPRGRRGRGAGGPRGAARWCPRGQGGGGRRGGHRPAHRDRRRPRRLPRRPRGPRRGPRRRAASRSGCAAGSR